MSVFEYDAELLTRYPDVVGGVILAHDLHNKATPPALLELYQNEQQAVISRLSDTPLSQIRSLSAWRSTFSSFGVEPTKYRSAPESLLRRLTKKGNIPSINLLVDLGNLVSIRYALPVAVFDTRQVDGGLKVKFAGGQERFTILSESHDTIEHPEPGEVIFVDKTALIFARRWCWRQSEASAAQSDTTEAIITVEAQHVGGRVEVESALVDLISLLSEYAGGTFTTGLLDATNPGLTY